MMALQMAIQRHRNRQQAFRRFDNEADTRIEVRYYKQIRERSTFGCAITRA
jgi:hypothetical protein